MTAAGPPYRYLAFGMAVESTVSLSGSLPRASDRCSESDIDTVVVRRPLPQIPGELGSDWTEVYADLSRGFRIYRRGDGFFLFYRGVGALHVLEDEIVVSPDPTADSASLAWLVTNLGLRLVLIRRGHVVFHASAVVVDDSLVAFAGPSGRGKSTLAAACYARSSVHHSDDLVPVSVPTRDGSPSVPPGPPRLRIRSDVADSLRLSTSEHTSGDDKRLIDTSDRHSRTERELDVLYLLEDADRIAIDEVAAQEAVFEILRHSYALYRDSDAESASAHLENCGTIARSVDVRRLSRPRSLRQLDRVSSCLEEDVTQ